MKRALVSQVPQLGQKVQIDAKEALHLTQVFRLRSGDKFEILDGKGGYALAKLDLTEGGKKDPWAQVTEILDTTAGSQIAPITLEICILKGDAMEWVIEKAVELGVDSLIPVVSAHTVVQISKKGTDAFMQRWQKIADQSLKQCGRLFKLKILDPVALEHLDFTAHRIWFNEKAKWDPAGSNIIGTPLKPKANVHLLIGPEGGWSQTEEDLLIKSGAQPKSLGPWVYRAETAALKAISIVSHLLSN